MADVARDDEGCKRTAASEQAANARQEFAQLEEAPEDWALLLERNAKMEVCPTLVNAVLIVQHDEGLQNIAYNDLKQAIEKTGPLPWRNDGGTWRDADDAQLLAYMNRVYQSRFTNSAVVTALIKVADDRHFNPLREYIQALPEWDGRVQSGHATDRLSGRRGLHLHPGCDSQDPRRSRPACAAAWLQI